MEQARGPGQPLSKTLVLPVGVGLATLEHMWAQNAYSPISRTKLNFRTPMQREENPRQRRGDTKWHRDERPQASFVKTAARKLALVSPTLCWSSTQRGPNCQMLCNTQSRMPVGSCWRGNHRLAKRPTLRLPFASAGQHMHAPTVSHVVPAVPVPVPRGSHWYLRLMITGTCPLACDLAELKLGACGPRITVTVCRPASGAPSRPGGRCGNDPLTTSEEHYRRLLDDFGTS